jgi:DNA polymerase III alpha subunit
MGVSVGPGRGSAGSVVAYCLKITNIDPLMYNLLFERFLNRSCHYPILISILMTKVEAV